MFPHMAEERCAALAAEIVVTVETKCACFVTESMTTMMESCPADCGSLTIKSTLMVSHGADGIGRGWSSPVGGLRNDLVQRHMSQESWLALLLTIYQPLSTGHCAQYR